MSFNNKILSLLYLTGYGPTTPSLKMNEKIEIFDGDKFKYPTFKQQLEEYLYLKQLEDALNDAPQDNAKILEYSSKAAKTRNIIFKCVDEHVKDEITKSDQGRDLTLAKDIYERMDAIYKTLTDMEELEGQKKLMHIKPSNSKSINEYITKIKNIGTVLSYSKTKINNCLIANLDGEYENLKETYSFQVANLTRSQIINILRTKEARIKQHSNTAMTNYSGSYSGRGGRRGNRGRGGNYRGRGRGRGRGSRNEQTNDQGGGRRQNQDIQCYECQGYGHFARDCANRRQQAHYNNENLSGRARIILYY